MARISVLETARESYELIRAHWKEAIVPLLVIFLISGASSFGSGFSRSFGNSYGSQGAEHSSGSALANAMADSGALFATLGAFILIIIAVVIVVALILAIFQQSLWFYVFEHFHALLAKRKISEGWKPRMKRQAGKSVFYLFFMWLVDLAIFIPFVAAAFMLGMFSPSFYSGIQGIAMLVGLAALFVAALVVVQFFLLLLWIYYAIDRLPLFESARRSISLVRGNLKIFVKYYLFMIAVNAAILFTMLNPCLCCLFLAISLPLGIFLRLLFAVTLMGLKLKIEKQKSAGASLSKKK